MRCRAILSKCGKPLPRYGAQLLNFAGIQYWSGVIHCSRTVAVCLKNLIQDSLCVAAGDGVTEADRGEVQAGTASCGESSVHPHITMLLLRHLSTLYLCRTNCCASFRTSVLCVLSWITHHLVLSQVDWSCSTHALAFEIVDINACGGQVLPRLLNPVN